MKSASIIIRVRQRSDRKWRDASEEDVCGRFRSTGQNATVGYLMRHPLLTRQESGVCRAAALALRYTNRASVMLCAVTPYRKGQRGPEAVEAAGVL